MSETIEPVEDGFYLASYSNRKESNRSCRICFGQQPVYLLTRNPSEQDGEIIMEDAVCYGCMLRVMKQFEHAHLSI